jgi:hypothetical protein
MLGARPRCGSSGASDTVTSFDLGMFTVTHAGDTNYAQIRAM